MGDGVWQWMGHKWSYCGLPSTRIQWYGFLCRSGKKNIFFSPGVSVAYTNAYFGPSSGSVLLTGLACNGNETSLFICSHSNSVVGTTGCLHLNDAGVNCSYG